VCGAVPSSESKSSSLESKSSQAVSESKSSQSDDTNAGGDTDVSLDDGNSSSMVYAGNHFRI
jgi:hypothetical protein